VVVRLGMELWAEKRKAVHLWLQRLETGSLQVISTCISQSIALP
jgi:hypothetical protein